MVTIDVGNGPQTSHEPEGRLLSGVSPAETLNLETDLQAVDGGLAGFTLIHGGICAYVRVYAGWRVDICAKVIMLQGTLQ